jgi:hypothetical protein
MPNKRARLHGFIVTHNHDKGLGTILSKVGKKYIFFERESRSFDFERRNTFRNNSNRPTAVTFVVFEARKPGGNPLARDIEIDNDFYEARAKEHYGEKYRTPEQRRAHRAAQVSNDVLVAAG